MIDGEPITEKGVTVEILQRIFEELGNNATTSVAVFATASIKRDLAIGWKKDLQIWKKICIYILWCTPPKIIVEIGSHRNQTNKYKDKYKTEESVNGEIKQIKDKNKHFGK